MASDDESDPPVVSITDSTTAGRGVEKDSVSVLTRLRALHNHEMWLARGLLARRNATSKESPLEDLALEAAALWAAAPEDVLVVTGSQIEGFGNCLSDVDLILIAERELAQRRITLGVGDHYLVCDIITRESVDALLARLAEYERSGRGLFGEVVKRDLDLAYRLAIGTVPDGDMSYRERFDRHAISALLADWEMRAYRLSLDSARDALAGGFRPHRAALYGQLAVGHALDSFLASRGQAFPSEKWRFQKLSRLDVDAELRLDAWRLNAPGETSAADYVAEVVQFCSNGLGMTGRDERADLQRCVPRRVPGLTLICPAGRPALLVLRTAVYELDDVSASLWRAIDGQRSVLELREVVSQNLSLEHEAMPSADLWAGLGLLRALDAVTY